VTGQISRSGEAAEKERNMWGKESGSGKEDRQLFLIMLAGGGEEECLLLFSVQPESVVFTIFTQKRDTWEGTEQRAR
jgi:hypothetical protein